MFEKDKKNENLIKNEDKINILQNNIHNTNIPINDDYFISHKDSLKIGENFSEIESNRISSKNRNSDSGVNLLNNNSITENSNNSNSNDINYSHKNLGAFHKIKFKQNYKKEEERNKSEGKNNNSSFMSTSYYFKTHYISYMCNLFSNSIGYESIWRFPYYFINAEGGVFFIPFLLFYFLLGIPILTIESALGQIFKQSPIGIFSIIKEKINIKINNNSIMTIKIITFLVSYIIAIYFGSLTAQIIHYFLLCFQSNLPWSYQLNADKLYHSTFFKPKFINHDSTHQNFDIFRLGEINYHRLLSSFLTWIIFYILIILKLDRLKHKYINRFLSFFPITMILIVFIACIHPNKGFKKGCVYFLIPKLGKLLDYRPWICGINQAIFLLMLGYGKNFLFSSSIKVKDNVYTRCTLTSLIILFVGIFCTFFDCIYAGLIAEELNLDSINKIPFNNSDIPFLTNLLAIGMKKYNRLFSILFLFSLIIIGFQSQLLIINNFCVFIQNSFHKYLTDKTAPAIFCFISFILSIPFTRFQGQFFLEWIDKYITLVPLIFIVFYEIIFIMKKLGINLLLEIISNKTNIVLPLYIFYFTKYITPIILIILMGLSFLYQYQNTQYSTLTKVIEWTILISPFLIFLIFLFKDCLNRKNIVPKDLENILREEVFSEFPKRKSQRKKTEYSAHAKIPIPENKLRITSSFNLGRRTKNPLSSSNEDFNLLVVNSNHPSNDLLFNIDNSIIASERETRKTTIEMEMLNNKNK